LKFEKTVTWPPENCGSVAVRFRLKTAVVIFGFKTVTALVTLEECCHASHQPSDASTCNYDWATQTASLPCNTI